jgi:hypothetical protein
MKGERDNAIHVAHYPNSEGRDIGTVQRRTSARTSEGRNATATTTPAPL